MKYLHHDLGHLERGDEVIVTLSGDSVNVRLVDPTAFAAYRRQHRHTFYGGHATKSPVRIAVPRAGHWHLVVDRGGYAVRTQLGVRVDRHRGKILPPIDGRPGVADLVNVGRNLAEAHTRAVAAVTHDVFISHASEDKGLVARPLHDLLVERGLTVWLDEVQLKVGAQLRRRIDQAVATSRYAVVVLSPAFFKKNWTNYELDGRVAREMEGEQLILPLWHNITKDQLLKLSPSLADRIALSTGVLSLEAIADELAEAIRRVYDE